LFTVNSTVIEIADRGVNLVLCILLISALGAVALGGKVYICGGFDGTSSLNSVETYDPETDEWTMISSMEKHRSASGVVMLNSQIYAIGGHDGLSIFDSVGFRLCTRYYFTQDYLQLLRLFGRGFPLAI